jgi:microsomal dipeptidase-like Zn-dependent dipeptidase
VRTRGDLEALLAQRAQAGRPIGALLGIEGAHALEGDLANLDVVVGRGFRMIGLTHFFDNEFAGSAHGVQKGGLTELGRALVRACRSSRVIDLAHLSPPAIDEVLAMATRPVVSGGVGAPAEQRTLSDEHVRAMRRGAA